MKTALLLLFTFSILSLQAQVTDRPTISSGGNYAVLNSGISFQSTLGESVIETISWGSTSFTQGFQQPEQVLDIPVGGGGGLPSNLIVYPNPAVDHVKIRFSLNEPGLVKIVLINTAGQMMSTMEQSCESGSQEVPFNFHVTPGLYLLVLNYNGNTTTTKIIVE